MLTGTTKSGFEYAIEDNRLDNMELLDAFTELSDDEAESALAVSKVCLLMLGKQQRKRLYDHLRREDGTVPTKEVGETIMEIMQASQAGKNS